MFDHADHVVVGLSGGADSVCLARYLIRLRDRGSPEVTAVHVNHMLRGPEADRDEAFVRDFCRTWDIPLDIYREDVGSVSAEDRISLEDAGRKVRYACFRRTMDRLRPAGKVCLCLAHHADDLAETMLFRMIRGTGPAGLVGIRPVQGEILRPFLAVRKSRILEILACLGQDYVVDASNEDLKISRNYLRHRILPGMEEVNPRACEHMAALSGQMADLMDFASERIDDLSASLVFEHENCYEIEPAAFLALPAFARQELARRLLFLASGHEKDIGSIHVKQLLLLAGKEEGKQNDFPYGVVAYRREGSLLVYKGGRERKMHGHPEDGKADSGLVAEVLLPEYRPGRAWVLELPGPARLSIRYEDFYGQQIVKRDCVKYFDYDKIKCNLCVRTRQKGDFFVYDDQGRHKRLSRYFIDRKIPADERDRKLLLCDGSHVLWVFGERISRDCRITQDTKRMIVFLYTSS